MNRTTNKIFLHWMKGNINIASELGPHLQNGILYECTPRIILFRVTRFRADTTTFRDFTKKITPNSIFMSLHHAIVNKNRIRYRTQFDHFSSFFLLLIHITPIFLIYIFILKLCCLLFLWLLSIGIILVFLYTIHPLPPWHFSVFPVLSIKRQETQLNKKVSERKKGLPKFKKFVWKENDPKILNSISFPIL